MPTPTALAESFDSKRNSKVPVNIPMSKSVSPSPAIDVDDDDDEFVLSTFSPRKIRRANSESSLFNIQRSPSLSNFMSGPLLPILRNRVVPTFNSPENRIPFGQRIELSPSPESSSPPVKKAKLSVTTPQGSDKDESGRGERFNDPQADAKENEENDDNEDEEENDEEVEDDEVEDNEEEDDEENLPNVIQYGAGFHPIAPPEVETFVPNMNFPSSEEMDYLNRFVTYQDAVPEKLNNRIVFMVNNGIRLRNLDKIEDRTIEEHVEKVFDIFIRRMIQLAKGSLEETVFWARLRYFGSKIEEFHVNHCTYAKGNGHVLMNNLALHLQSDKEIKFDQMLEFSMFVFKDSRDTSGQGRYTLNDKVKKILRLDRQYVQTDGYCLPVSIVIGRAKSDYLNFRKSEGDRKVAQLLFRSVTRNDKKGRAPKNQLVEAKKLLRQCGLDENKSTHDFEDLKTIASYLKEYQFVVWHFDSSHQNITIRDHLNAGAPGFVGMYFENNHYEHFTPHTGADSLRTTFCHKCSKLIHHRGSEKNVHSRNCEGQCRKCGWTDCVADGKIQVCKDCNVTFFGESCYRRHLEKRSITAFPHCKKYRYCNQCFSSVKRIEYGGVEHACGKQFCVVCRQVQAPGHNCTFAPPSANERTAVLKKQEKWRFLVYDFETITSDSSALPSFPTSTGPSHVPNLVVGKFICSECWESDDDKCLYCGDLIVFSYKDEQTKGTVVSQFLKFLQTDVRLNNAILLAHNGGKYDHAFVLSELAKTANVTPNLLLNGNQVIQSVVNIPDIGKITFKDTLNFLPMALSQMPAAFGLENMAKGTFPYLYNHQDHYGTTRRGLPDKAYYQPDFMSPDAKAKFLEWYEVHKNDEFDFDKEILDYCKDDVKILVQSVKKYLNVCSDLFNGWNPIVHCSTLASFVMFVMKFEHFKVGDVGYIPETGFPARNNSPFALKYLQFLDSEDPSLKLQHALSKGEKVIACGQNSYYVDGYSEDDCVYGCYFHGCRSCFTARSIQSPCRPDSTVEDLYQQTIIRQVNIENAGYVVEAKWECEIKKEMASNKKMKDFFTECRHTSRLNPRDSMYGGRTQAFQAYVKADDQHTLQYFDYCSLYPWTNMIGAEYPRGQPKVIRSEFKPIVPGARITYRGLVYCDILPPLKLGIAVLPYKARGKLLFPLCRKCAEKPPIGNCLHNEEKSRFLTGTWYSEEINLAIDLGYKILRYHEVWDWDDSKWIRGGFFKKFLSPLLKIKHEASGWPRDNMTEEEKTIHVETIAKNDGVDIDSAKVKKNPAMRQMAKLFLNSSWGKFAQNPQKTEMKLIDIDNGNGVFNFLNSAIHEPTCLEKWGDNHLLVARKPIKETLKTPNFCNVVFGSITTSVARIRLYEAMQRVGAKNLIYCDTDSVIFRQRKGADLLGDLRGDGLGKLTDEVPRGSRILEIVVLSPKVYAYKMIDQNRVVKYVIKAKGMTLNCSTRKNVTFNSMKKMMLAHLKKQHYHLLKGHKISLTRGVKRPLDAPKSVLVTKKLRPISDKGHVLKNGSVKPFGYSKNTIVPNYPF